MQGGIICQGRNIDEEDIVWLKDLIAKNKSWSRHRIGTEICRQWDWRTASGQLKTFAARSFLQKLHQRNFIELPPVRVNLGRRSWDKRPIQPLMLPDPETIACRLADIKPVTIIIPDLRSAEDRLFQHYLAKHHYLGFSKTVGEHIKYLVQDRQGRDLACLLFGSAAWKTAPRDAFIGWSDGIRQRNVNLLTNNTRFLILPWVRVPHLASHILGNIMRRIRNDWQDRYGHTLHMVETFVERDRFRGTCYKAANWRHVGVTKGRSRQDRYSTLCVPVKDIYVYPLIQNFRKELARVNA